MAKRILLGIRTWYIYKITNPVGDVYIGRTSNLDARRKVQMNLCPHFSGRSSPLLIQSIKKYGGENHSFKVIDTFDSTLSYANGKEIFWIRSHMSNRNKFPEINGLNMVDGGIGIMGYKYTQKTRDKMSKSAKEKIFTLEHRAKIKNGQSRAVVQFDLQGNFIKDFPSIQSASLELWGNKGGRNISLVCKGKRKSEGGYIFRYKKDVGFRQLKMKRRIFERKDIYPIINKAV